MQYRVVDRSSERITQKYKVLSHKGVDIGYNGKDESKNRIFANCKGIVYEVVDGLNNDQKATGTKSWGNFVYIKHPNGMFTRYAHIEKGVPVKVGQEVDENTVIGIIGNTGRSFGRHLHFEVAKSYSSSTRIDPTKYLTNPVYENEPQKYTGKIPSLRLGIYGWKRGDKNQNVGYIQSFLNWYLGCNLKIDNSYGSATETQVLRFQKQVGISTDGKFGPACIKKMKSVEK